MDQQEAKRLCRGISAICPSQAFEAETPALWREILADVRYEDARAAVVTLGKHQRYIAASDIFGAVQKLRRDRLDDWNTDPRTHGWRHIQPETGDIQADIAEKRAIRDAVADGTFDVQAYLSSGTTLTGCAPLRACEPDDRGQPKHLGWDERPAYRAALERTKHALKSPPRVNPAIEGRDRPAKQRPTLREPTDAERAAAETERGRQLAKLGHLADADAQPSAPRCARESPSIPQHAEAGAESPPAGSGGLS